MALKTSNTANIQTRKISRHNTKVKRTVCPVDSSEGNTFDA